MAKQGILEKDTDVLVVYTHEYYCDNEHSKFFEPTKEGIENMCEFLGIQYKTLKEEISRGRKWINKSIWKMFKDEEKDMIRLV